MGVAGQQMNVVPLRKSTTANLCRGRRKHPPPIDLPPLEVKSAEGWRYQWHRLVLERRDLAPSEKIAAGALMHAYQVKRGYAEIALTTLAQHSGFSRGAIITAVNGLRALGLVDVANAGAHQRGSKIRAVNRYRLIYRARGVA